MNNYLILFFRSVATYLVMLLFTRIMGRKQLSQLTYFDYVLGATIGSIAAVASVDKTISVFEGCFSIIIWSLITLLISEITLKNIKLRLLINSEPLLIINNGKVISKNMKKAKYNIGDLLMQLRVKDIFYITDVEIAILEPDGKLSVLKKAEKNAVTAEDMHIQRPKSGIMIELILDGNILYTHLEQIQKNEGWVLEQLKLRNVHNLEDVIFAELQADGQIYIVTKND